MFQRKKAVCTQTKFINYSIRLTFKKNIIIEAVAAESETVILVEAVTESISTPHVSVAFSKSHLKQLKDDIDDLKKKVMELAELPSNLDLINASRDKSQPIVDMFQILSLNKRIGATEEGITKMASMVEDLARSTPGNLAFKFFTINFLLSSIALQPHRSFSIFI